MDTASVDNLINDISDNAMAWYSVLQSPQPAQTALVYQAPSVTDRQVLVAATAQNPMGALALTQPSIVWGLAALALVLFLLLKK